MPYYKVYPSSITILKEMKIPYPPDYFPKETFIRIVFSNRSLYCLGWLCTWSQWDFPICASVEERASYELDAGCFDHEFPWLFLSLPFVDWLFPITVLQFTVETLTNVALLGLGLRLLFLNGSLIFADSLVLNFGWIVSYLTLGGWVRD